VTNIVPEGPQNLLFGDDLIVMGVDAPTSFAVHRIENPPGSQGVFINADSTFVIDRPQTGLVRVAIQGDWTNGGRISANLTVERHRRPPMLPSAAGVISQDDMIPYYVDIPTAGEVSLELFWLQNWGRYPTNDLDLFVLDPAGNVVRDAGGRIPGATLNSPERVTLTNPVAGRWTLVVSGFAVNSIKNPSDARDVFVLTAAADGKRLRITK
jgi:hypothetical protein